MPLVRPSMAFTAIASVALTLMLAGSARALGLGGLDMSIAYYLPDASTVYPGATFTPPSFVVGSGQETAGDVEGVTTLLVDFDEVTLDIDFDTLLETPTWNNADFSGLIFMSVLPHGIVSATVDIETTMSGLDDSRISLTSDRILVNWAGLSYVDGTKVKLNFSFNLVPEPAGALLIGAGLLGLGCAQRRRAKQLE
jgi:hypothetical protein